MNDALNNHLYGDPGLAALDIERLEGLLAKATDAPWMFDAVRGLIYRRPDALTKYVIADMESGDDDLAALIVEAVNALPHLLARLKAAEAELDAYPKVGEDYAHKGYPCQWRRMTPAEVQALIDGDEAAAEIEALRAEVGLLREGLQFISLGHGRSAAVAEDALARAALENRHG